MWNACTSESGSEMFTAQQLRALTYVSNQVRETGVAPSFDEIREHLGLKSKSGVHRLLTALEERGAIRRLPNRARAVEIRRLPESLANADRPVPAAAVAGVRDVPLMGRIAAGTPIAAIQVTGRSIGVPDGVLAGGEHFALEVKGDSMTGAGILDGDVVVLRRQDRADVGDIVVALIDGEEATLKRLRRRGDSIALEAANPDYATRILPAHRVTVQGKLVSLVRKY